MSKTYQITVNASDLTAEQLAQVIRDRGHGNIHLATAQTRGSGLECCYSRPGRPGVVLYHGPIMHPGSWVTASPGQPSVEVPDPVAYIEEQWAMVSAAKPGEVL